MKIIFKNQLILLGLISITFDLHAVKPKTAAEIAKQEAQIKASRALAKMPLRLKSVLSIIQQINSGKMSENDLKKLPAELQEYINNLRTVLIGYNTVYGNQNIQEHPTQTLFFAINIGAVNLVQDLLAMGAQTNVTTRERQTPLMSAATNIPNSSAIIELLIANGAHINAYSGGALFTAIAHENLPAVITLIENGADLSFTTAFNETPLHYAARIPNDELSTKIIKFLLDNDATKIINNEDSRYMTAIIEAARNRNFSAVKLLLENGANAINKRSHTTSYHAYKAGAPKEIIELLLKHEAMQSEAKKQKK